MMLWFVLALMTAAAVFSVLWPLARRKPLRAGSDMAVYRDQLDEIERDRAAGLIGEREAEAARVEVSRRLIAAAEATALAPAPAGGALWRRRALTLATLVLLPIGAVSLYLTLGSPDLPAQPQAARPETPPEHRSLVEMVGRVEAYIEQNPDDGHGWEVLGPVYMRIGRYDAAVRARRNVLRLLGSTAEREADLGEALTGVANGVVTAEARETFERAVRLNPDDFRARFFLGLAAEQDGRPRQAAAVWRELLASAPADASWVGLVQESLARVDPSAAPPQPSPSAEDVAAASGLSPEQQAEMARGMVAKLAERLKQDGSDVEAWLQLVRSYMVLGERDKARAAAADARKALAGDPDKLLRLIDGMMEALAARVEPRAAPPQPGPSADDIAAANKLPPEQQSEMVRGMVARLAERLKQDGSDVQGWLRLVRSYMVLGDQDKANAAAADARRALAGDPEKLRQFDEISKTLARAETGASAPSAPPPLPQPGPSADDIAAASKLSPEQQSEMVRGMVARLAERLKQDGSDVEGWLRLVRAYMVLGDKDKARAAAGDARKALASDPDKLRRIDEMIKGLGLQG